MRRDYAEAAGLFSQAAKHGIPARFTLGEMYEEGLGVSQDLKRALILYSTAAADAEGN
ncbi:hypothetical protein MASR2M17_01080 [Aminivibrio sp.]